MGHKFGLELAAHHGAVGGGGDGHGVVAVIECRPGEAAGQGEGTDAAEAAREDDVRAVAAHCRVELILRLATFEVVVRQRSVAVECSGRGDAAADEGESAAAGQVPTARDLVLRLRERCGRHRCHGCDDFRRDEGAADEYRAIRGPGTRHSRRAEGRGDLESRSFRPKADDELPGGDGLARRLLERLNHRWHEAGSVVLPLGPRADREAVRHVVEPVVRREAQGLTEA